MNRPAQRPWILLLPILTAGLTAGLTACPQPFPPNRPAPGKSLLILSWNVQNLFDTKTQGTEYEEYRPGLEWTPNLYRRRLERTAEVIRRAAGSRRDRKQLPDILLLQEVENRTVLEELNRNHLDSAYPHILCPRAPGSPAPTAVMGRLPPPGCRAHLPAVASDYPQRYILEAHLPSGLILFCSHWKSRLGGEAQTAPYRDAAERLLASRIRRIAPRGRWLAAGDFNQKPEAFSLLAQKPPPAAADFGSCNAWDLARRPAEGSYYYGGSWERIDHFFLGPDTAEAFRAFSLPAAAPWADSSARPEPWQLWNGKGYSDHLPLLLELAPP